MKMGMQKNVKEWDQDVWSGHFFNQNIKFCYNPETLVFYKINYMLKKGSGVECCISFSVSSSWKVHFMYQFMFQIFS